MATITAAMVAKVIVKMDHLILKDINKAVETDCRLGDKVAANSDKKATAIHEEVRSIDMAKVAEVLK